MITYSHDARTSSEFGLDASDCVLESMGLQKLLTGYPWPLRTAFNNFVVDLVEKSL